MAVASMISPTNTATPSPPKPRIWSFLAIVSIVVGLATSAAADDAGRANSATAQPLFWVGLLAIFVPIAIRLLGQHASQRERLLLVLILYGALYLVSFLQYPLLFTSHDSLGQIRSAEDIVQTGHLFKINPIVSAYASYPGIELVTSSLSQVSGLSLFASGALLVGVVRAVFAISLYLAVEHLTSAKSAGIACLVYATNPSFLFFDAQFAYESLALPIAMLVVAVLVQRRSHAPGGKQALATFLTCALVVTHFATTIWLLAVIVAWVLIDSLPVTRRVVGSPGWTALFGTAAALGWFFAIGRKTTVSELGPVISSAFSSVFRLVSGKSASKQLFAPAAGLSDPLFLQIISFLSVGILVALIAISFWDWRRAREPLQILLIVLMVIYPLTLVLRLTADGTETSQRASEFVFIGIGLGVGGLSKRWLRPSRFHQYLGVALAVVLFVGGVVVSTAPYTRLPGPYLVGADARSIDAQTIAAATWVRKHLPAGSVFAADRSNGLALAAIGLVDPANGLQHGQSVPNLYFSQTFGAQDKATIRAFGIQYILVDLRLSTAVPYIGLYFSPDEPLAGHYKRPIPRADLTKFASAPGLTQIYDNGDIQIYQVGVGAG